jgi:CubicO group peptidase (beta-lactamase class C family)
MLICLIALASWQFLLGATAHAADEEALPQQAIWPMPEWSRIAPAEAGLDEVPLLHARDYALTGGGSGYVTRHGRLVLAWGDAHARYDLKSTTKSFGSIALGLAIKDGKLRLEDKAQQHHPTLGLPPAENARTGWLEEITILQLASQTAGFEKPGGYTQLLFPPGTQWDYSDSGPNWLAECITLAYGRDLEDWMFERVFTPLGIGHADLMWRKNAYRPATIDGVPRREFGAGIHASVDAMARIGYLMLREGEWNGQEILTRDYAALAPRTPPQHAKLPVRRPDDHGNAASHYGLLWWNNADRTLPRVPADTYWSWGLYDSLIIVIPTLDIVVSRAGQSWKRDPNANHYDVLKPFLEPIVQSVAAANPSELLRPEEAAASADRAMSSESADYPRSPVIKGIVWAPPASIQRCAKGSDNWPITWADDDWLYTAYGDGNGFEPLLREKLSLGLCRIQGEPGNLSAENLRAPSLETKGPGPSGKKASGMLMVGSVLYLWARNADNSQLAWSADHGATWTWADWKLNTSFGCPTFLNFGRNYQGARDDFAYIYSHDSDSAYQRADRMVLARVAVDQLQNRAAYEFLQELDGQGRPVWTKDITRRGAVMVRPGRCYRSSVSFNAGLNRYLWVQTGLGEDTRFAGGLAIYDAPEPWGPWTSVFSTDRWDVGPGETASFPTKWMSADGCTLHLVFSGDDCFSVRRATVQLY